MKQLNQILNGVAAIALTGLLIMGLLGVSCCSPKYNNYNCQPPKNSKDWARLIDIEKIDGLYRLSWRRYNFYFDTVCDTMPPLVKGCWYPDSVSGYKKIKLKNHHNAN